MINIKEIGTDFKNNLGYEPLKAYELTNNNETIGFGTINKDNNNLLSVYIKDEYRGNGYGTELFNNLLSHARNMGYNDAKLTVSKHNTPAIKMIQGANGFETSTNNEYASYVVPLNHLD